MSELSKELDFLKSGANIALLAKHVVDGFLMGMHSGTRHGVGGEFSQYRSYQPGDDIRQVDWKMYGRSDRYYIKEAETDTSVTVRFFLDASASMNYIENNITRFRYASLITASLATLAYQQGDAIALHIVNDESQKHLREKRGKSQLHRFYSLLDNPDCKGKWPIDSNWLTDSLKFQKRELWIVCSDLLDGVESWKKFVSVSEALGHEVQFIQVLGEGERTLNLKNSSTIKDPESDRERNIRVDAVRDQYLKNLNDYLEELKQTLRSRKIEIDLFTMDTPVNKALHTFLKKRAVL
ncbi:MAG: DUF58 domain-containing protein [Balneolaceae bacterium]